MSWRHVPINERSKVALLKANLVSGDDTIAILVMLVEPVDIDFVILSSAHVLSVLLQGELSGAIDIGQPESLGVRNLSSRPGSCNLAQSVTVATAAVTGAAENVATSIAAAGGGPRPVSTCVGKIAVRGGAVAEAGTAAVGDDYGSDG